MPIVNLPEACDGCGACCYGLKVEVTEEDFAVHGTPRDMIEIGPHPDDDEPTPLMKQVEDDNDRCVALDPETRRCTIYENRPSVCRQFTRGDDSAEPNDLCFDVVGGMRIEQGRMALPPKTRFQEALAALRALTGKDIDAATDVERLKFLRYVAELQAGLTLTMLADLIAADKRTQRDVAILLNENPEALRRLSDSVSREAVSDHVQFDTSPPEADGPEEA